MDEEEKEAGIMDGKQRGKDGREGVVMAHMVIQWYIELVTVTSHYFQHCNCPVSLLVLHAVCAQQNAAPGTLDISSTNCELLLLAGLCC